MRKIPLSQGKFALVDNEDYERVNAFKWFAQKSGNTFYAKRGVKINGKWTIQLMHRFIMGDSPDKSDIDHEDGDGCNNWKLNLRPCTHQENMMNQGKPNKNCSSKYLGVYWDKATNKWRVCVQIDGKTIHLGSFIIEEDAARAYDAAKKKHNQKFCRLNFPI